MPSLVEEKNLGAAIWVRRPTESALNILVISSPPCEFHVCKRLWVVMVLDLLCFQVSTGGGGSQDGGAVSGEGAGCGLGQVFGFPVHAD